MKIRIGTFETNSSSTHSIVIPKNVNMDNVITSSELVLDSCREFGWEISSYSFFESKFNYLMQIYLDDYLEEKSISKSKHPDPNKSWTDVIDQIVLTKESSEGTIFENLYLLFKESSGKDTVTIKFELDFFEGYVDHGYEYAQEFEYIMRDLDLLRNFLFSTDSEIHTDNDNY